MSRLQSAVFDNDLKKIAALLDRNPARIKDAEAFCLGIAWGHVEAVRLLIHRGVDVNAKDPRGNHPLYMACMSSATELFDELVRHGSDPRAAAGLPTSAAFSGRVDVLKYLRSAGFDLNQPDPHGDRPIDAAIGMGNLRVVDYLLRENVDTWGVDVTRPLSPWKGAVPDSGVTTMEEIRNRIIAKRSEPGRGSSQQ